MREIQFREALREAMSEEMRRDPSVFLMGEEVAEYNGA
ncbi:MAG: alpha-ketoacid dehydrogenase subunit beta, partial [Cytophagales bacterium]